MAALPDDIEPILACPAGDLAKRAAELGIARVAISATAGSLRLHVRHTPVAVGQMAAMTASVARHARRVAADIVHANTHRAGIVSSFAGLPVVVHLRDVLPEGRVSRLVTRAATRRAAAVVAISQYVADAVVRLGGSRPQVIFNPIDTSRLDTTLVDRDAERDALGLASPGPLMVLVAQITPWKGQRDAVQAISALRASHPQARVALVGTTMFVAQATRFDNRGYLAALRIEIAALGLDDAVDLLGQRDDVPRLLAAADVVWLPSWEEPFGRAAAEAMAASRPVVATDVGGTPEFINNGVNGFLVPPRNPTALAEATRRLLEDPIMAATMATCGRDTARRLFDTGRHVGAISAVYDRVLERSPRRTLA
jgi:glycosyltransferase involved in cell wall biosynthesis